MREKIEEDNIEDDRGMAMQDEGMIFVWNLVERQKLRFMVEDVLCIGGKSVGIESGVFLRMFLVDDSGGAFRGGFVVVGRWYLRVGESFVVVVVEVEVNNLKLVMECIMRLLLGCLNGTTFLLWHLSLTPLEANFPIIGGFVFRMMMWEDFMSFFLFLIIERLGEIIDAKV